MATLTRTGVALVSFANLNGARLTSADPSFANLYDTNLGHVDLYCAHNLFHSLGSPFYYANATFSVDFDRVTQGWVSAGLGARSPKPSLAEIEAALSRSILAGTLTHNGSLSNPISRLPSQPLSATGNTGRLQPRTQIRPKVTFQVSSSMASLPADELGIT